jgi:hypothetical protein
VGARWRRADSFASAAIFFRSGLPLLVVGDVGDGEPAREDGAGSRRSTQGFSGGVSGVVYCESAASGRSNRRGVQTPMSRRHAAMSRFACT